MLIEQELSYEIIGAMKEVSKTIGPGCAESLYEGAMEIELNQRNLIFERQKKYKVYYKGELAGTYKADLVIENKFIIELKSVSLLTRQMEAQLLNYLRISKIKVGFLVNFRNIPLEVKRFIL